MHALIPLFARFSASISVATSVCARTHTFVCPLFSFCFCHYLCLCTHSYLCLLAFQFPFLSLPPFVHALTPLFARFSATVSVATSVCAPTHTFVCSLFSFRFCHYLFLCTHSYLCLLAFQFPFLPLPPFARALIPLLAFQFPFVPLPPFVRALIPLLLPHSFPSFQSELAYRGFFPLCAISTPSARHPHGISRPSARHQRAIRTPSARHLHAISTQSAGHQQTINLISAPRSISATSLHLHLSYQLTPPTCHHLTPLTCHQLTPPTCQQLLRACRP